MIRDLIQGEVLPTEGKLALMFHIPGHCAGCKKVHSMLENKDLSNLDVILVDAENDDNKALINLFSVQTAPTIVIIEDGQEKARLVGLKEFMQKNEEFFGKTVV